MDERRTVSLASNVFIHLICVRGSACPRDTSPGRGRAPRTPSSRRWPRRRTSPCRPDPASPASTRTLRGASGNARVPGDTHHLQLIHVDEGLGGVAGEGLQGRVRQVHAEGQAAQGQEALPRQEPVHQACKRIIDFVPSRLTSKLTL